MTDAMSRVDNDGNTKHKLTVVKVILSHVTKCRISGIHPSFIILGAVQTQTYSLASIFKISSS